MKERRLGIERAELDRTTYSEFLLNATRYTFASQYANLGIILDIACGTGYGVKILSQTTKLCIGADNNFNALKQSKTLCDDSNTSFIQCDCYFLPFREAAFDLITSIETIEHLKEPQAFLEELARCVKPGGRIVISTPNREYKVPWVRNINPYHIYEWNPYEFSRFVSEFFKDIEIYLQWPPLKQRVVDNIVWTMRKLILLSSLPIASKVLKLARGTKLIVFRPAPNIETSNVPLAGKYGIRPLAQQNLAGIKKPQTIIIVAQKEPR